MDEGKPQLYGSQIKNGKLYKLDSPKTVNERRKEMGLEPIEEYLKRFNIEYRNDEYPHITCCDQGIAPSSRLPIQPIRYAALKLKYD